MKIRILFYRFLERLWGICGNFYSLLFITPRTSKSDGTSLVLVCYVVYIVVYIWDALQRLMMLKDWLLSGAATLESCENFKCWSLFGRMSHWDVSFVASLDSLSLYLCTILFPLLCTFFSWTPSWKYPSCFLIRVVTVFDPNDYELKPLKLWATISGSSFGIVLAGILLLGWKSD